MAGMRRCARRGSAEMTPAGVLDLAVAVTRDGVVDLELELAKVKGSEAARTDSWTCASVLSELCAHVIHNWRQLLAQPVAGSRAPGPKTMENTRTKH